mgnify:CR=1 FL=1
MTSTAAGASGSQDEAHWALPSMLHNDDHHRKSPSTSHHIWSHHHSPVSISNNNSAVEMVKPIYELQQGSGQQNFSVVTQAADGQIMKQECDSSDITGEDLGADIHVDGVKVSLIQDGDQTLTLYDLNQNHETKVGVLGQEFVPNDLGCLELFLGKTFHSRQSICGQFVSHNSIQPNFQFFIRLLQIVTLDKGLNQMNGELLFSPSFLIVAGG